MDMQWGPPPWRRASPVAVVLPSGRGRCGGRHLGHQRGLWLRVRRQRGRGQRGGGSAGNSGATGQRGGWQRDGWERYSSFNLEQQLLGLKLIITVILSFCVIDNIHR